MESVLLSFFTSIAVVLAITPSIISVAKFKNIFDIPTEKKLHKNDTPRIGGTAIFIAVLFSYPLWRPPVQDPSFRYMLASMLILFLIGIKDDIIGLSPLRKLGAQLLVSLIIVMDGEGAIRLTGLHGFLNMEEVPYWASVAISVFTIIVITNSFNLIDGIDGLAAGLGLISSLAFGFWFFYTENLLHACLAFSLSGALLGILFFNYSPAKIFIGDCGSLIIGFLLSLLTIRFIELNAADKLQTYTYLPPSDNSSLITLIRDSGPQRFFIRCAPAFAVAAMIVPLYDTLRSFLVRIVNKKSPFEGDTNHLHHRLLFIGFSQSQICVILFSVSILFIVSAFLLRAMSSDRVIIILFALAVLLDLLLFLVKRAKTK